MEVAALIDKPMGMALGIIPDSSSVIELCEKLLANGCASHQVFFLGDAPLGNEGPQAGQYSLRWVPPVAGMTAWSLAQWSDFQRTDNSIINSIEKSSRAIRKVAEASVGNWLQPYVIGINSGFTMMIILLNDPWQEIVFGKLMLKHAVGRFQTVPVP